MFRSALLLGLYAGMLLLPFGIFVDFLVDQERIARELCVQRNVEEPQRTCHGQCHLAKQLKKVEGVATEKTPKIPDFRYEVQYVEAWGAWHCISADPVETHFGRSSIAATCDGFVRCPEGVPWA